MVKREIKKAHGFVIIEIRKLWKTRKLQVLNYFLI